jgi:hypothetical protein
MSKESKYLYTVYYMPTADMIYFKDKPSKKDILKAAKKYQWGDCSEEECPELTPAFDMSHVDIVKEKFE